MQTPDSEDPPEQARTPPAPLSPTDPQEADVVPWPRISSRKGADILVGRVRFDLMTNPRTGKNFERLVLEMPAWVNVVALTSHQELIVVRQFRFGSRRITTELPGGLVDAGEEPLAAAKRELREETGYSSSNWTFLGAVEPNPAFQDNLCHHFLATDVEQTHPLALDDGEDIAVSRLPLRDVPGRVRAGTLRHSLVLSALSRVIDLR